MLGFCVVNKVGVEETNAGLAVGITGGGVGIIVGIIRVGVGIIVGIIRVGVGIIVGVIVEMTVRVLERSKSFVEKV